MKNVRGNRKGSETNEVESLGVAVEAFGSIDSNSQAINASLVDLQVPKKPAAKKEKRRQKNSVNSRGDAIFKTDRN